jgi:hypothetical protein
MLIDVLFVLEEEKRLRTTLEWYADYVEGLAREPQPLPSQGVAFGMLHRDGGRRARKALGERHNNADVCPHGAQQDQCPVLGCANRKG